MQRRSALLIVLVLLLVGLTGCSSAGWFTMRPVPNASALSDVATQDLTELENDSHRLAVEAVNGSEPTVTGDHPPFTPEQLLAIDGAFYNVTWSQIDSREVPTFDLSLDSKPSNTTGQSIAYRDLPVVDQRAIPAPDSELFHQDQDIATLASYNETEQHASVLVPEPQYELVQFGNRTVRIAVEASSSKTISTYRYDVTQVATTSDELAATLKSKHLFRLQNLSTAQRAIVTDAIDSSRSPQLGSDAWNRLVAQFVNANPVTSDVDDESKWVQGEYLVRYNGTVYWADISGNPADQT